MADKATLERFVSLAQTDPDTAQRLLKELTSKQFVPHEAQRNVIEARERFLTMCAGRRFGKTKVAAHMVIRRARRSQQMIWWVAPTYKIVKRGYAEVIRQLPKELLAKPAPSEGSFDAGRTVILHFKTGAKIEFYSAERPEGMLGEGVDFAVMDEAATMPEHVWQQIVRPTLADRAGGALFISTPRGRNWFYTMYQRGQDPLQTNYASWRFPSMANPFIPAEEWEEMAETLPRAVYEQEILADFISNAASVFRIPNNGVGAIQEPKGHVVLGVDLAKHNDFTVIAGVNSGDRQPCFHDRFNAVSWPEQRARLRRAIDRIEKTADSVTVMLDSTGIGDVVYDDLSYEGLDAVPIKFTPQWKQHAVMLLAADIERNQAFLHEAQVREFEAYSYSITDAGRWKFEAGSGHDDEVSAMLLAHWGVVNEGVPDIHLLEVDASMAGANERDVWDGGREDVDDASDLVDTGEPHYRTADVDRPSLAQLLSRGLN